MMELIGKKFRGVFEMLNRRDAVSLEKRKGGFDFKAMVYDQLPYSELETALNESIAKSPSQKKRLYKNFFSAIKDVHLFEALQVGELAIEHGADASFVRVLATRYKRYGDYKRYRDLLSSIGEEYRSDQEVADIKNHLTRLVNQEITSEELEQQVEMLLMHFPHHSEKINELAFSYFKDSHTKLSVKFGQSYLESHAEDDKFARSLLKRHISLQNHPQRSRLEAASLLKGLSFDRSVRMPRDKRRTYKEKLIELSENESPVLLLQYIDEFLTQHSDYAAYVNKVAFAVLKDSNANLAVKYGLGYLKSVPDDAKFLGVFSKRCLESGSQSEIKAMNEILDNFRKAKNRIALAIKNIIRFGSVFNKKEFRKSLEVLSLSMSADSLAEFISTHLISYPDSKQHIYEVAFSVLKDCHTDLAINYGRRYLELTPENFSFAKVFVRRLVNTKQVEEAVDISRKCLAVQHDIDLYHIVFKFDIQQEMLVAEEFYLESNFVQLTEYLSSLEDKYSDSLHYLFWSIHKFYFHKDNEKAIEFAKKSLEYGESPTVMRSLYDLYLSQGHLTKAIAVIPENIENHTLAKKRRNGESFKDLLLNGFPMPNERVVEDYQPIKGKVFYMLHNRLPYNSGGYAARSHGLLTGVFEHGWTMHGVSRLGYPADKMSGRDSTEVDEIDSIQYHRMLKGDIGLGKLPIKEYLMEYAEELIELVKKEKPEFIHAASNYMNGVVANYVARSLGIKSIYEVRGLWEITRISRQPDWFGSEYYNLMSRMEAEAANNADVVFTLTTALKNEMVSRGVDPNKIEILPNGVNSDRFLPRPRNEQLALDLGIEDKVIIGFIGSVVWYEGLDYLVAAAEILLSRGIENFAILIVGDGAVLDEIKSDVVARGLQSTIIFTGRVPHERVEDYYSIVDIAPFPRKGIPVCEMVSPLKPFEAMSMEKAVLSSNVAALSEIVLDGENGLLFQKDNIDDLAAKLEKLIVDEKLRNELGIASRKWVVENRDWRVIAKKLDQTYSALQLG